MGMIRDILSVFRNDKNPQIKLFGLQETRIEMFGTEIVSIQKKELRNVVSRDLKAENVAKGTEFI